MLTHNRYQPLINLDQMDEGDNKKYSELRSDPARKPIMTPVSQPRRQEYEHKEIKNPPYHSVPPAPVPENNYRGIQAPRRGRDHEPRQSYNTRNNYNPSSNHHYRNDYDRNNYDRRDYNRSDYNRKRPQGGDFKEGQSKRHKPYYLNSPETTYKKYHAGQPQVFFQPQKKLQQTVVEQQKKIETLEKKVEQHEQTVLKKDLQMAQLQQQIQQLHEKRIKETISEKITRHMAGKAQPTVAHSASPIFRGATGSQAVLGDYSQAVLLRRINLYLESIHKEKISEKGYCHGIVLLWLTMMSWGVEPLFYEMIKTIADCPLDQLARIDNTIIRFLDWIEVGQFPGKYSNKACTQQNVNEIIGDVQELFAQTKTFSKGDMAQEFQKLAKENNMISVTGWWNDKVTGKEEGHTVGVYIRDSKYHFYDSNFKTIGDLQFDTEALLVDKVWERVFSNLGIVAGKDAKFSVNAVHRPEPLQPVVSYTPTLFGGVRKQQPISVLEQENSISRPMVLCS